MIIGKSDTFAIRFSVDGLSGAWVFGNICYLVGGRSIGDYDLGGSLTAAVGAFLRLLEFTGMRKELSLMPLSAGDVFRRIDNAMYVDSGQSDEQVSADWRYYRRFHAKPVGFDVFDNWKCYLIEDGTFARFLWKDLRAVESETVSEQRLALGEFDQVISAFVQHLRDTYPECREIRY